jgi:hypothetical protein
MAQFRRARRVSRRQLSYANVMATAAVFIALGGGAYAATALPRDSVGPTQLRAHAVTSSALAARAVTTGKIDRRAVTMSRLSRRVRARLDRRAAASPGAQGPKGDTGATGPAGIDALGARRIAFDAAPGAPGAEPTTVLDMPGLLLQALCTLNGTDVNLGLRAKAPEDTVLQANFTVDGGDDPTNPPQPGEPAVATANSQITLPADAFTDFGGPGTQNGAGYFRVNASAIVLSDSRTITLNLVELVNADTGRCTVGGTALPSS